MLIIHNSVKVLQNYKSLI